MKTKKKIILYFGGGAMSGIFGAGIITKLQEMNFYNKIEAIYGTSAGAIIGAYFLTKQSELGSSIYYENLIKDFILPGNIPYGFFQRLWNGYIHKIPKRKIINALDINYLFSIIKNKKILDIKKLKKQKIPLYVKLLNLDTGKIKYLDAREGNTLKILKAAVSIIPYWFFSEKIDRHQYADGNIKEIIGLNYLLKKYPNHKIVVVLNFIREKGIKHYIANLLEATAARAINKRLFKFIRLKEKLSKKDIELSARHKRVLLIHPPENDPDDIRTTNRSELLKIYKIGKKEAEKIKEFVKK